MSEVQKKQTNLREKLAELLDFRKMRDRLSGLGLYIGKDRTNTDENLLVRGGANVDDLQLAEISAAVGGTAVDVFVYDTSRDSDGGKWRERTQHTSWYNEELNTSTRGARREFPAVAVIVAEADKVTIYDGNDPDLSMWMVFESGNGHYYFLGAATFTAISILNGKLICVSNGGSRECDFISEYIFQRRSSLENTKVYLGYISNRNGGLNRVQTSVSSSELIVNDSINDLAMTVLPNAPIDEDTGLPVPTIAVATDGGVSVIKDDGNVVDITSGQTSSLYSYYVVFDQSNRLFLSLDGQGLKRRIWGLNNIPATDLVITTDINEKQNGDIFIADNNGYGTTTKDMFLFNQSNSQAEGFASDNSIGTNQGLFKSFINKEDSSKSLYNYITSKYNTGWMPGDIKLAALSDSVVETVGVSSDELVVDGSGNWVGNFNVAGDLDSWTDIVNGNYSIVSGELFIDYVDTTSPGVYIDINVVAGRRYILSVTSRSSTAGQPTKASFQDPNGLTITYLGGEWSGFNRLENDTTSNVDQVGVFSVESSGVIRLRLQSNSTTNAYFDNISVRATTELITNGDFSIDVTGWSSTSGASISHDTTEYAGGALQINQNSSSGQGAYQSINTIIGQSYVLNVIGKGDSIGNLSNLVIEIGTSIMGSELGGQMVGSGSVEGNVSITFVASSTITYISLGPTGSDTRVAYVDNISVRPAEEDRSVNSNGLQIFGEIQKTPVAPGADLVAYSGFSANDYLVQPYNEDLDFGTGDFCVMGWARSSGNSQAYISIGPESATGARVISGVDSGNRWFFTVFDNNDDNDTRYLSRDLVQNSNAYDWVHLIGGRRDGVFFFYLNGLEMPDENNTAETSKDLTNTNASEVDLKIGVNWQKTAGGGELALVRISKTAPTAEQIAKIYRDEKPLFQQGAQATLYGTSDAVTALAYDQKTELLHVGTASGRSDFSGLSRVHQTNSPVTTCIDAEDGLIAEN
jgi:hypothetical protein